MAMFVCENSNNIFKTKEATNNITGVKADYDYFCLSMPNILTDREVQNIFNKGDYQTYKECVLHLELEGYIVSNGSENSLRVYSKESEEEIRKVMRAYYMTRKEAINFLSECLEKVDENTDDFWSAYNYLRNIKGLSKYQAVNRLKNAGHKIPKILENNTEEYTEKEEQRIEEYIGATGSTREQATKELKITAKDKGFFQTGVRKIENSIPIEFVSYKPNSNSFEETLF